MNGFGIGTHGSVERNNTGKRIWYKWMQSASILREIPFYYYSLSKADVVYLYLNENPISHCVRYGIFWSAFLYKYEKVCILRWIIRALYFHQCDFVNKLRVVSCQGVCFNKYPVEKFRKTQTGSKISVKSKMHFTSLLFTWWISQIFFAFELNSCLFAAQFLLKKGKQHKIFVAFCPIASIDALTYEKKSCKSWLLWSWLRE